MKGAFFELQCMSDTPGP